MDKEEVDILKQRLDPVWLMNHTNIFEHLNSEDSGIALARFRTYWGTWISDSLKDMFKEFETLKSHVKYMVYQSDIDYAKGTRVVYNGKVYESKENDHVNNQPDTSPKYWKFIFNRF